MDCWISSFGNSLKEFVGRTWSPRMISSNPIDCFWRHPAMAPNIECKRDTVLEKQIRAPSLFQFVQIALKKLTRYLKTEARESPPASGHYQLARCRTIRVPLQ